MGGGGGGGGGYIYIYIREWSTTVFSLSWTINNLEKVGEGLIGKERELIKEFKFQLWAFNDVL